VKELAGAPPALDRVPVTAANRRGIVDPLTAVLFSAGGAGDTLSQEACRAHYRSSMATSAMI
jgi:hypothetical protein